MRKGSKHSSYGQMNYAGIPDTTNRRNEVFLEAVKQAAVSGVIEPTYDKLPEAVKREFSFKTFERKVEQVL